jgi:HSP20 family protein
MLTRWDDWGFGDFERGLASIDDLRRHMNQLFEGLERGQPRSGVQMPGRAAPRRAFGPRIDLHDDGQNLLMRAELPGFTQDDLDIQLQAGSLTLRGRRQHDVPEGYSVHRRERASDEFARSFTLPCRVDAEKTSARLREGVLELTLPKAAEDQPRQINVRSE